MLLIPVKLLTHDAIIATACSYRTTARIWKLSDREIVKVIDLGPVAKV